MSHPRLHSLTVSALLGAVLLLPLGLSTGCGSGKEKSVPSASASNATPEQRRLALRSQAEDLHQRLTELEQRIADTQKQHSRELEDLARQAKDINQDFTPIKREIIALASGEPLGALPAVDVSQLAPSDPAAIQAAEGAGSVEAPRGGSSRFLQFFLWGIVIVTIGFFVSLFVARKDEEYDDYDAAETGPDVKLNEYGSVQMPPQSPAGDDGSAGEDDPEHAGRP